MQTQLKYPGMLYVGFVPHEKQRCYTASHGILAQPPWLTALSSVGAL